MMDLQTVLETRTIGRKAYLGWGLGLFALKHGIDLTIAEIGFGRDWSLYAYLAPADSLGALMGPMDDRLFYWTLLACAMPFIVVGVMLTRYRLRDAGLPGWLVVLFFVPLVNFIVFALLSVLPGRKPGEARAPIDDLSERPVPVAFEGPAAEPRAWADGGAVPPVLSYGHEAESRLWQRLGAWFPRDPLSSAALACVLPMPFTVGFSLMVIRWLENYGWGLFVGLPFALGLVSAVIHGIGEPRSMGACVRVGILSVFLSGVALFGLAIEGLACLVMCAPLTLPIGALGAAIGYTIQNRPMAPRQVSRVMGVLLTMVPLLMGAETALQPPAPVYAVTTSIEVDAPPMRVWENVLAFPEMPTPEDWVFRLGISHPIRATMQGTGVGARRECIFSTGAFVEPIEVWDEGRLLKFAVTANPPAMKEWSPYGEIDAPHVKDFLVSRGGQFKLIPLPGKRTRIEGTTWYQHHLWPAGYWRLWSDHILHTIHRRVLEHVKGLSERE